MSTQLQKPLWKHQENAIERAKLSRDYAFLFDPGLGKTRATIEVLRHRYTTSGRLLRTLIVCPLIVTKNWKDELLQFTKIHPERIIVLEGSGKNRVKQMTELFGDDPNKIVICNYETLLNLEARKLLINWFPEVVVSDEMHLLKNVSAKRSKHMRELSKFATHRYGLTGTAILNTPLDIFAQWLFLDAGNTFGENYYAFRNRYFTDKNAGMPRHIHFPKLVIRPGALEEIKEKLKPLASTAIKSECLDLPPLIRQTVFVELSKEQTRHYTSLKEDYITWMKGSESAVVASTALVRLLRLMQLTSGHMTTEEGEEISFKDNPKEKALEELLSSLMPNKVIIWAIFKKNYEVIRRVCAKLGIRMVECHGEITSNAKKFEAVDAFNSDPSIGVFLGHPSSLGIGINITIAPYAIYYSRDFDQAKDVQSEARNYRGGSEIHENITRYDIVMKDTVDELGLAVLRGKRVMSADLVKNWVENALL